MGEICAREPLVPSRKAEQLTGLIRSMSSFSFLFFLQLFISHNFSSLLSLSFQKCVIILLSLFLPLTLPSLLSLSFQKCVAILLSLFLPLTLPSLLSLSLFRSVSPFSFLFSFLSHFPLFCLGVYSFSSSNPSTILSCLPYIVNTAKFT